MEQNKLLSNENVVVTIRCMAYNHEPYIRQCLEGFVMQKTNFRFEAIVHDDASTDGTATIIREYAEKYPDIIKPIFETENQYSKHDGALKRIMDEHTHGKYVAYCEGDDYWIDPFKLQKQVDFLERNPEYSMCFHNAKIENETGTPFLQIEVEGREYLCQELYDDWIVPTASIVVKRIAVLGKGMSPKLLNGDIFVVLSAFTVGKVWGISDTMSVYRVHLNGITLKRQHDDNLNLQYKYLEHYNFLKSCFEQIPSDSHKRKIANTYINIAVILIRKYNLAFLKYLLLGLFTNPGCFMERLKK